MTEYQAHAAQLQAAEDRAEQAQRARTAGFEGAPVEDEAKANGRWLSTGLWLLVVAATLVSAGYCVSLGLPVGVK